MPSYSLRELAEIVGGEILGDPSVTIDGVAGIREAEKGEITFIANPKYEVYLGTTQASAVIADSEDNSKTPILKVSNPYLAFLKVVTLFSESAFEKCPRGIHQTAIIDDTVEIGGEVSIGAHAVIGAGTVIGDRTTILPLVAVCDGVKIGSECLIFPHVTIREHCEIGDRVIIHSGTVIGSDGFGYVNDGSIHNKIPQIGIVRIEDDVEIGANSTVDRATTGVTLIGRGSKLDNLVQIAHNVVIGDNSILAAQVGVSGSTELGKNVTLAGQAGLVGHIKIGEGAKVGAQSGVTKSISPQTSVSGYPAREHGFAKKTYAATARLPEILKEFRKLKARVEQIEKGLGSGSSTEDD